MTASRDHILLQCIHYLENQKCVLWSQSFDLSDEDSLKEAANWLTDTILEIGVQ